MNNAEDRAFAVKDLAVRWQCSAASIYEMINAGTVRAFTIGKPDKVRRRKGLRISAKEVARCEGESENPSTAAATAPSVGARKTRWPSSAMRKLASASG
jgi:hypothetical protein